MSTCTFIRHAESVTNAGGRSTSSPEIPLTPSGRARARRAARDYDGPTPELIVVSPYLRAEETAGPFIERFPAARVEHWPVHEFTFLNADRYRDTTSAERQPAVKQYWRRTNPHWVDGPGAESFATFMARMRHVLHRLRGASERTVLVFSHETAIKAAMWMTENGPVAITPDSMREFHEFALSFGIPNLGRWTLPAFFREKAVESFRSLSSVESRGCPSPALGMGGGFGGRPDGLRHLKPELEKREMRMYRQGDILLVETEHNPDSKYWRPAPGYLVLARGERTGHEHVLLGPGLQHVTHGSDRQPPSIVTIPAGAQLRHPEHAPVTVPPGAYEVRRQREYTRDLDEERRQREVDD